MADRYQIALSTAAKRRPPGMAGALLAGSAARPVNMRYASCVCRVIASGVSSTSWPSDDPADRAGAAGAEMAVAGSGTGPSEDGASCAVMEDCVLTCSGIDGAGARGVLMVACPCSCAS